MRRRIVPLAFWIALALGGLLAQTPTGTIQGIISDASGAVVPDAKVVLIHVETNTVSSLSTDQTGRYILPLARPGMYTITVEKTGFRSLRQENISLDVSGNRSVNLTLEIGAMTQEVRVDAAPPVVDVNTSSVGQVIENKRIMDLPLNG